MRGWLLVAAVALLSGLAALSFPSDGSAFLVPFTVTLTAAGPSPRNVTLAAGLGELLFVNDDSVSHSVVFANGRSLDVAPGGVGTIAGRSARPFPLYVGSYAFTVDGTFPGDVHVVAASRTVTLEASTHSVRRGSPLTLHGELTWAQPVEAGGKPPFPVIVLARDDRQHAFHRIAMVSARLRGGVDVFGHRGGQFDWHLRVRPGLRTTYVAEAIGQRTIWKPATSSRFAITIRR